ncbi:MAG: PAS domain S-box protein [Phycisphaera sp.]|nr:PAS domain S-box protein [Phycisphaera sp.]
MDRAAVQAREADPEVWPVVVTWIFGGLSALLGVTVMAGWYAHSSALIQVVPTFAPMQYNTALGFLLSGVGMIAIGLNRLRIAGALGVIVTLLGLLTLVEYIFGINLGIDQLFMDYYIMIETSDPGRMSPPTAFCFTLTGVSCMIAGRSGLHANLTLKRLLLSTIVLALGGAALTGYVTGHVRTFGWGASTRMAVHTAFGFVVLSVGYLVYLRRDFVTGDNTSIRQTALLAASIGAVFVIDMVVPLGVAVGVLYVIPVVLSQASPKVRDIYTIAAVSTLLTVIGVFESRQGASELWTAAMDRMFAITCVWVVAVLAAKHRVAEMKFAAIVDSAPDALIIVNSQGEMTLVNHRAEQMFGYSGEEIRGRRVEVLMPSGSHAKHAGLRQAFMRAPKMRTMGEGQELLAKRKNGDLFPVEISLSPIETTKENLVAAAVRDVTDRKAADEAIARYNDMLTRSNEELDRFAYIASHDLKAPLRAIDSLSQWIAEDMGESMSDTNREQMTLLRERVARMEKLLDDLLAYSRVGRQDGFAVVDTKQLVQDVVALLGLPESFVVAPSDDLPVFYAAATPLEQVMRNLIGNAYKHRDRQDVRVDITAEDLGTRYAFTVADNGAGIDPRFHKKAFAMFQTLNPRDEVEGSGMGLALVKKIVETYGGSISLTSDVGSGAAFRFTWPKHEKDRPLG